MKNLQLLLVILLVFSLNYLTAQDLRVATLNCEFLVKSKVHVKFGLPFRLRDATAAERQKWEDDAFREKKFREACKAVAGKIKEINADILGLTEVGKQVDFNILNEELEKIGMSYKFLEIARSSDHSTGQTVAIFSQYRLKNVAKSFSNRGLYYLENDLDELGETGLSKAMRATAVIKKNTFDIYLFHLKSERGFQESDAQRLAQAKIIRRIIMHDIEAGKHVIVMGDFNSERRHDVLQKIRGFNDPGQELLQTGDDKYFRNFDIRWTYQFRGNLEQIDHILLSLNFRQIALGNSRSRFGILSSIIETKKELVSDHNPFIVDFTFKKSFGFNK